MENQLANEGLYDPQKKPGVLVKIECKKCGYTGEPHKWSAVWIFGILYVFTILNLMGLLVYLLVANPYSCSKCNERNQLTKILNNGKRMPIRSLSRKTFLSVSIVGLVLMGLIVLFALLIKQ